MIATTSAKEAAIPGYCTDAAVMPTHGLDNLIFGGVPNLELASVGSHSEMITVSWPLDTCYAIILPVVSQFSDLTALCSPQIDTGTKANG